MFIPGTADNAPYYRGRVTGRQQKKAAGVCPAAFDPNRCRAPTTRCRLIADAGGFRLADLLRLVAELVGLLDEGLLLGRILFDVRL